MKYEDAVVKGAVFKDTNLQLQDGKFYGHCAFVRVIFEGEGQIAFCYCTFDECLFRLKLVDVLVSRCTLHKTELQVTGKSVLTENLLYDAHISIETAEWTLGEQVSWFLYRIPLLGWLLQKRGLLRLPEGTIVSDNVVCDEKSYVALQDRRPPTSASPRRSW